MNQLLEHFSGYPPKILLFDSDGVIADSEKYYFEATKTVFESLGRSLSIEEYRRYFLYSNQGAWHLLEPDIDSEIIELKKIERGELFKSLLSEAELINLNVEEAIIELSQIYRMAVVTSAHREHFETVYRKSKIPSLMEFVLASGDYSDSKPSPAPYLKALDLAGVDAQEALVIEDSPRGLASASAAGIGAVLIKTELVGEISQQFFLETANPKISKNPLLTCDTFLELKETLVELS